MLKWFRRRRTPGRVLTLRSRGESSDATRVDFAELAPDVDTFLGQAAYLQLGYFETLSQLITATPDLAGKESLSRAAGAALIKHRDLVALIRDRGDEPTTIMLPFREQLEQFAKKPNVVGHYYWTLRMGSGWDPRPTNAHPKGRQLEGTSASRSLPDYPFRVWSLLEMASLGIATRLDASYEGTC